MCEKVIEDESGALKYVPNYFKIQRMCERAVENDPYNLRFVPLHLKVQEICEKAVEKYPLTLIFVPDWFVTQQQIKIWHDDDEYCNDDEIIEWYDGYQKRKAQKASIKEELLPITWHPSRWWDWCISEDEKRDTEALWA